MNNSKTWKYEIKNQLTGQPTQVMIYDDIGATGITANNFVSDIKNVNGDLDVHLSTSGGDVFEGLAIYNALSQHKGKVQITVDSLAASIGSVIAMAASPGELVMAKNASIMIHEGHALAMGDAADMTQMADTLNRASDNIASIYADRTGKPASYWRSQMKAETWYNAQEAVSEKLADRILPGRPQNSAKPADDNGWVSRDGKWVFDPDNDGDDDSTPEGDTDHDYFDEHGHPLKPVPPKPDRPANHAHVQVLNWDGPEAMSKAANSDNPASAYRAICAGRKAGDPDKQSSWALPHHPSPGADADPDGVRNALARLPQTQGLENESAAKAHLEKHMKDINPDSNPDDALYTQIQAALKEVFNDKH